MNAENALNEIRYMVGSYAVPGDWPDDIDGRCGGNYDDAFSLGAGYGEELLAERIRRVLAKHEGGE